MRILGVEHTPVRFEVPKGACDCHTHVFGPASRFPWSADRVYTPPDASVEELDALHRSLGIDRVVVVHPSPYGTDNACSLDAIRRMGERARGVAVIDVAVPDAALREMHEIGIRGVRLNLETGGIRDPAIARARLEAAAERVAPLGWHVQTFTSLHVIEALHDTILSLATTLVIDHFGRAEAAKGVGQPGFDALLSLVRRGKAYVKLSASYRISSREDRADVVLLARALIEANPERMLWGTDWPHPGGGHRRIGRDEIEPFHKEDDGAALNRLADWAGDASTLRRILVDNPARLYGFA
jgi:predicted TIM-barrel fold metal-dependent hydrolase